MKRLFVTILLFIPVFCMAALIHGKGFAYMDYSGTHYYSGSRYTSSVTSGNPTVAQSGSGYTFTTYDTLTFIGSYTNIAVPSGITGAGNCIDGTQATVTNTSFQQLEFYNCDHLTMMGFQCTNYYATIFLHIWHDNKFLNISVINNSTNSHDQPFFKYDWPNNADMIFTGSKSQTFYNDSIIGCRLDGYKDNAAPIACGTSWDGGNDGGNARDFRSLCLDFVFANDTIANCSSTGAAVGAISGTGPNAKFTGIVLLQIDGYGSHNASHNESILWYGYITVDAGYQYSSYAEMVRNWPLDFTGLTGYSGQDVNHTRVQNILVKRQLSYSAIEISTQGIGDRTTANGFHFRRAEIIHNTVDSTTGLSYNGPARYQGKVVDLVEVDSATVDGNVIFRPEMDYASVPYNTDSASHNGYIYSEIGAAAIHLTLGNNFSSRYSTGYVNDSTLYIPKSATGPQSGGVATYPNYSKDRYGVAITTYKGAAAFVVVGPTYTIGQRLTIYFKRIFKTH